MAALASSVETFLTLEHRYEDPLPEESDDVRTPRAYVEHVLREHTDVGDVVFDPFAGFGTTLAVATELGREAVGVELEADRVAVIEDRVPRARVVHGDALALDEYDLPRADCCLTSPPYVVAEDGRNPYENYAGESTYADYLADTRRVFSGVADLLAPGGTVLVDVSNMKHDGEVTTLAWDVADELRDLFAFEGEVVVGWTGDGASREQKTGTYGYGYDHSYCLVFSA